jgi:Dipeptidyl peptidase IV (DPP IV) N-terminal region
VHVFSLPAYDEALSHQETNDSSAVAEATSKLKWEGMLSPSNSIIDTVTWVANETLIVKEVTRAADDGNVVFFDLSTGGTGRVTRRQGEKGEEGDGGWIDQVCPSVALDTTFMPTHTFVEPDTIHLSSNAPCVHYIYRPHSIFRYPSEQGRL